MGKLTDGLMPTPNALPKMAGTKQISLHQVRVFAGLMEVAGWQTNRQIASRIGGISERCVRSHTRAFAQLKLVEHYELFPEHRYRIATSALDTPLAERLKDAARLFGIELKQGEK